MKTSRLRSLFVFCSRFRCGMLRLKSPKSSYRYELHTIKALAIEGYCRIWSGSPFSSRRPTPGARLEERQLKMRKLEVSLKWKEREVKEKGLFQRNIRSTERRISVDFESSLTRPSDDLHIFLNARLVLLCARSSLPKLKAGLRT